MTELSTAANLPRPDELYQQLIDLHDGLTEAESRIVNAKLILLLANHIGDTQIVTAAIAVAAETGRQGRSR